MKLTSLYKITFGFILVVMNSALSQGQYLDLEKNMDCALDKEIIKEHKINSLIVYADFNENGIINRGSDGGKIREVEFDKKGNVIYSLTSSNGGNLPFLYYGRGSKMETKEFDEGGNMINFQFEGTRNNYQVICTFDNHGRKLSEETILEGKVQRKLRFEWQNEKLVKHIVSFEKENDKKNLLRYDEKGRVTRNGWGNNMNTYKYDKTGDTLTTISTWMRADTIVWTEEERKIENSNYLFSYVKRDHNNALLIEMKVKTDSQGNANFFYLNDLTNKYMDEVDGKPARVPYPPSTYEIVNHYDDRKLLVKREFFYSREDVGARILTKIERYFYDTEALPFRFEKGNMMERIENY